MKKAKELFGNVCLILVLAALLFTAVPAVCAKAAPTPAEFYKANTVTIICPFGPGGGSDYISRLFARHWHQVTGGTIIIKNMPGAGSITGANYSYKAKPDGLTVIEGGISATYVAPTLARDPAIKYDITKINWIGGLCTEPWGFSIAAGQPYKSIKDLQKAKGLRFPAMHPADEHANNSALLIDVFNLDAKIVIGYHGTRDIGLACGRGEVHAAASMASGLLRNMKSGFLKSPVVLFRTKKGPYFPEVPLLPELAKLTPKQKRLLEICEKVGSVERVFGLQPGVPKDRLQFCRDAFHKMTSLESFQKQHKLYWPVWTEPLSGQDLQRHVAEVMAIPKPEMDQLHQLVHKYLAVK